LLTDLIVSAAVHSDSDNPFSATSPDPAKHRNRSRKHVDCPFTTGGGGAPQAQRHVFADLFRLKTRYLLGGFEDRSNSPFYNALFIGTRPAAVI